MDFYIFKVAFDGKSREVGVFAIDKRSARKELWIELTPMEREHAVITFDRMEIHAS